MNRTPLFLPVVIASLLVLAACVLSGCAGPVPGSVDYTKMTPEAIKAMGADKSITANCTTANSVYGRIVTVSMSVDKGTVVNGGVAVDSECKVTVTNTTPPKAASAP